MFREVPWISEKTDSIAIWIWLQVLPFNPYGALGK